EDQDAPAIPFEGRARRVRQCYCGWLLRDHPPGQYTDAVEAFISPRCGPRSITPTSERASSSQAVDTSRPPSPSCNRTHHQQLQPSSLQGAATSSTQAVGGAVGSRSPARTHNVAGHLPVLLGRTKSLSPKTIHRPPGYAGGK
ncbi:unnamed protein product, partial [Amoebophrya sp. A120]